MNRMEKIRDRVAEGNAWWARYVAEMNACNEGKVAIGCALNPNDPLKSERRYASWKYNIWLVE